MANYVERDLLHGGREGELRVMMLLRARGNVAEMTLTRGADIRFRPQGDDVRLFGAEMTTGEVKADKAAARTGNIFVETACYGRDSGISRRDAAAWWFYVLADDIYVVHVDHLRLMARSHGMKGGGDDAASVGYLVPVDVFKRSVFVKRLTGN